MASRATNEAVETYRALLWAQHKATRLGDKLNAQVVALSSEEFREYVTMTSEIDVAVDQVEQSADGVGLADSTFDQYLSRAIHSNGLDRT